MKVLLLIIAAITATAQDGIGTVMVHYGSSSGIACEVRLNDQATQAHIWCPAEYSGITTPPLYSVDMASVYLHKYKVCWYIPSETNVVNCSPVFDFDKALAVKALIEKSWIQEVK